ncbi:uncharacterized protein LOC110723443 [Chenopodium quinoa]|uniref:uncharacterized protein LOC110723443 n=1 Tax=Chenopodium quinoa TaxID=63459 RepID=UPI000B7746D0|nr:uncharacterized protein LOC110723443 [Chenopodium quinoa]
MDPNNPNYGRNMNFPTEYNANTPPFDPNIFNNPQFQAALQWFGSDQRPINPNYTSQIPHQFHGGSSSQNVPLFPMSQYFTQPMDQYPRVNVSSTASPTEDVREAQHLEDLDDDVVDITGEDLNDKKATAWSITEDKALVSGYINAGGNVTINTKRTKAGLWAAIGKLYEEARVENLEEIKEWTIKSMQQRWDFINKWVSKWVMAYNYILRHPKSGNSGGDAVQRAHEYYAKLNHGKHFTLMHCFETMQNCPKWDPHMVQQLPLESEGSGKRSKPESPSVGAGKKRPMGIKKSKSLAAEGSNSSTSINLEAFNTTLDETSDKRLDQGERMIDLISKRSEDRKKLKEEEMKFSMLRSLMAKPVLDEFEVEMYKKLREEFSNRFFLEILVKY